MARILKKKRSQIKAKQNQNPKDQQPAKKNQLLRVNNNPIQHNLIRFCKVLDSAGRDLRITGYDNIDIVEWIVNNRWIEGGPWSFESSGPKIEYGIHDIPSDKLCRPYLFQFLRDKSPERAVIKNRQSEFTENHINEALFYINNRSHTRVSHIFPTDDLGNDISNEKIAVAILESPNIGRKLKGGWGVHRYSFVNGSFYTVTGALKKSGGRASTRDLIIYDEIDWINESIFGIYDRLMEHSSLRLVRKISTPTIPLVGIDKEVKKGCEYVWHWKCPKCKKEQQFVWPDNCINFFETTEVDQEDPKYIKKVNQVYIGCSYCKSYLDRNSEWYLQNSLWIPKKPGLEGIKASYYVNAFMIPWKTGKEILLKYHSLQTYVHQFYNEIFGIAYLKGDNRLTEAEMLSTQRQWHLAVGRTFSMRWISCGIDWGEIQSWIVISCAGFDSQQKEMRCIVYVDEINSEAIKREGLSNSPEAHVDYAIRVIERFKCDIIINDANGIGIDRNKRLLSKFPKRVFGAFFDTAEMGRQLRQTRLLVPQWSESNYKVTFSKVGMLKDMQNEFRRKDVGIPLVSGDDTEILRKFMRHHSNLAIQPRWSEENQRDYEIVVKLGDADHLADADMYSKLGFEKLVGFTHKVPGVVLKR